MKYNIYLLLYLIISIILKFILIATVLIRIDDLFVSPDIILLFLLALLSEILYHNYYKYVDRNKLDVYNYFVFLFEFFIIFNIMGISFIEYPYLCVYIISIIQILYFVYLIYYSSTGDEDISGWIF